jgi:uncharacterized protein YndB with AHSA1/START domain
MTSKTTADREIVVTRVFDAPRDLVFAAFTEREHVEHWWVPNGTMTHEWNVAPGGLWRYSMPGPDGTFYPFKIEFIEIARPARLVYDYSSDTEDTSDPVRTTVTFEEENGHTRVTLQLLFASAAEREEAARYGGVKGAKQALESLADYLAEV